jgi:hypothetical protein
MSSRFSNAILRRRRLHRKKNKRGWHGKRFKIVPACRGHNHHISKLHCRKLYSVPEIIKALKQWDRGFCCRIPVSRFSVFPYIVRDHSLSLSLCQPTQEHFTSQCPAFRSSVVHVWYRTCQCVLIPLFPEEHRITCMPLPGKRKNCTAALPPPPPQQCIVLRQQASA